MFLRVVLLILWAAWLFCVMAEVRGRDEPRNWRAARNWTALGVAIAAPVVLFA